jgi:glucosamine--fructose-6-phosphate aminotransferase (isomerizing)
LCGIFGCVFAEGSVAPLIRKGLKRLEYRGYDSVGIATVHEGVLQVRKDQGKIDEIAGRLGLDEMQGSVGIGHTRWATHGAPMMVNAHPHTDCSGRIAVIHNGVIENFLELKEELINAGHNFVSRTDTEVIPHLIEEQLKGDIGLEEATLKACRQLK